MLTSDQALRSYYMLVFQLPFLPERLLLAGGGAALRRMLRGGGPAAARPPSTTPPGCGSRAR